MYILAESSQEMQFFLGYTSFGNDDDDNNNANRRGIVYHSNLYVRMLTIQIKLSYIRYTDKEMSEWVSSLYDRNRMHKYNSVAVANIRMGIDYQMQNDRLSLVVGVQRFANMNL